jgi:hypothetical protein
MHGAREKDRPSNQTHTHTQFRHLGRRRRQPGRHGSLARHLGRRRSRPSRRPPQILQVL